jgi:pimeloyl-ACP methyl ester carboxylesterase
MFVDPSRLLLGAAAAFDRAATLAALTPSARRKRRDRAESLGHGARMEALARLVETYEPLTGAGVFRAAAAIDPEGRRVRRLTDGKVDDLRWPSGFVPFADGVGERFESVLQNRRAAVRFFRHDHTTTAEGRARPAVLLIHGYLGGKHALEERMWPLRWLYGRLGFDVALLVLPFHGVRARPGRKGAPPFPGSDPRMAVEGFRQAIGELGDLVAWLHERGNSHVGVMGMSLGGYTTSLAATVDPSLAFAVPVIPLASLADFANDQGRLGATVEEASSQHAALERVYGPVSPLHREPAIESRRILIVAAQADRITPLHHAKRLANHFGAPLETFVGGHLLQFGRARGFRRVGRMLGELGVIQRPD